MFLTIRLQTTVNIIGIIENFGKIAHGQQKLASSAVGQHDNTPVHHGSFEVRERLTIPVFLFESKNNLDTFTLLAFQNDLIHQNYYKNKVAYGVPSRTLVYPYD